VQATSLQGSATTERALEMLTQVTTFKTTLTRTPLEAALLENERIKALNPPYNVHLLGCDPLHLVLSADLTVGIDRA